MKMINVDREELAWAGGFFSGEGTTYFLAPKKNKGRTVNVAIGQAGIKSYPPDSLVRFQAAVFGLGKIYGPYRSLNPRAKPIWKWASYSFENVQATISALWPWLSEAKQRQVKTALKKYHSIKARHYSYRRR